MASLKELPVKDWRKDGHHDFYPVNHLKGGTLPTVAAWADKHRTLSKKEGAAIPGQWMTARTPYLRQIMEAFSHPLVRELTVKASSQSGKTQVLLNCLAWTMDIKPEEVMVILPRDEDCGPYARKRIKGMIDSCKKLRTHTTGVEDDVAGKIFELIEMTIRIAGANSPADLSSDSRFVLFFDEINKYPVYSGREASPIKLAGDRAIARWRERKFMKASTPTTTNGQISKEFDKTDKRRFWWPCPTCGRFAPPSFSKQQDPITGCVRWPRTATPEQIGALRLAWYECGHCEARIEESSKPWMLAHGVWCPEGFEVEPDGAIPGDPGFRALMGWHIHGVLSVFMSWSELAQEFLECEGRPEDLMDFINSKLGEDWTVKAEETKEVHILKRCANYQVGEIPEQAKLLLGAVDVQKHEMWYGLRAFGYRESSWLVTYGKLETFDDIVEIMLEKEYETMDGRMLKSSLVNIDSGYRTDEVYQFCRDHPGKTRPIKGEAHLAGAHISVSHIDRQGFKKGFTGSIMLWKLDTNYFKDKLSALIHPQPGDLREWYVPETVSEAYLSHLTAEHKTIVRNKRTGKTLEAWEPVSENRANHLLDVETYILAAAEMRRVFAMKRRAEAPELTPEEKAAALPQKSRSVILDDIKRRQSKGAGFINKWRA